jgi:hypothetical protein
MKHRIAATALLLATQAYIQAQGRGGPPPGPPQPAKVAAPIDLTGYWVSLIVDEWRFRVTPQKGDIPYLPLNAEARRIANEWDPAKDEADGKQCKAYGAVGVMQRPGRLHITWDDDNTLRIEADAGTQTRIVHFGAAPAQRGEPSWQGYSTGQWQIPRNAVIDLGGVGFAPGGGKPPTRTGTLKVVTSNMRPGYIRKNGVPYSGNGVLTEYFNRVIGANGEIYFAVTAMLDDPMYLNQPFVRTYQFKQQPDAKGWEPTPCLPR